MAPAGTYLLFPGGMPDSLALLSTLKKSGAAAVGASSMANDQAAAFYDVWAHLPFIEDPEFEAALLALIAKHGIATVYSPHPTIAHMLTRLQASGTLSATLHTEEFARATTALQHSIFSWVDADEAHPLVLDVDNAAPALSRTQKAALMTHALRAEGQSSDAKLLAMMEVMRRCPAGDIIEIGSFWGRSAMMLAMLSTHYHIGNLLCMDPWDSHAAVQEDVSEQLNAVTLGMDFEAAYQGFLLNLFPFSQGRVNCLREDASAVHARYHPGFEVSHAHFGTTRYTGAIAMLHIDGNHSLEPVTRDIAQWAPLVKPGGWIIIDDYQWAFGTGPCVAADRWMDANRARIHCAFVTGSALFIKLL